MAEFEKTEFEFPDEAESKNPREGGKVVETEDTDIEVIDDTPEEDRGRKPQDPPKEVTDEELEKYTDQRLKTRLAHLVRGYHYERRAKEAAHR